MQWVSLEIEGTANGMVEAIGLGVVMVGDSLQVF